MCQNFRQFRRAHSGVFLRRVLKGIPDSVRSRAWLYLLDPKSERLDWETGSPNHQLQQRFDDWTQKADTEIGEAESIPGLAISGNNARILQLFHNGQPSVAFQPAEGLFASILLAYMDEVKAFDAFLHLMAGPKRMAKNYFDPETIKNLAKVWETILRRRKPAAFARMKRRQVRHEDYVSVWLTTAFLKAELPPGCRLRVFDRFLAFGARAIFSLGLSLVDFVTDLPAETIVDMLVKPTQLVPERQWERILSHTTTDWIPKTEYKKVFRELRVLRIP
jgi:hypothetical protein